MYIEIVERWQEEALSNHWVMSYEIQTLRVAKSASLFPFVHSLCAEFLIMMRTNFLRRLGCFFQSTSSQHVEVDNRQIGLWWSCHRFRFGCKSFRDRRGWFFLLPVLWTQVELTELQRRQREWIEMTLMVSQATVLKHEVAVKRITSWRRVLRRCVTVVIDRKIRVVNWSIFSRRLRSKWINVLELSVRSMSLGSSLALRQNLVERWNGQNARESIIF